jgi:hypothetical protein
MVLTWTFLPEVIHHGLVRRRIHYPNGYALFKIGELFSELTVNDNENLVWNGTHLSFSLSRFVTVASIRARFSCLKAAMSGG